MRKPIAYRTPPFLLTTLALCFLAVGATLLAGTGGCGSGGSNAATGSTTTETKTTGRAVVTIQWPKRPISTSRLLPEASNLVQLQVTRVVNGAPTLVGSGQATRSADGSNATIEIDNLPVDALTVTATAYPNADPNNPGVALASGTMPVTTKDGQAVSFNLTMNSTIDHLSLQPSNLSMTVGQTQPLTVIAWNGPNESTASMVLLSPDKMQWTTSASGVAQVVYPSGQLSNFVTAVAIGPATVSATDTESTKTASIGVSIHPAPTPTPTPTPTPAPTPTPMPTPTPTPSPTPVPPTYYNAVDIGTPGANYSFYVPYIYGMNATGQVACTCFDGHGTHAFLYTPGGGFKDLGNLGGSSGNSAQGINDGGTVVGTSRTNTGESHAFAYSNGAMQDLGTPGTSSSAYAVNDSGQIVGMNASHAALYTNGGFEDLGVLATGTNSQAYGVNHGGQVIGISDLNGASGTHAFLYTKNAMQDLGTLPGATSSIAYAINAVGQVVGETTIDATGHAFLYENGTMQSLETLAGTAADSSAAFSINDSGQIVGFYDIKSGSYAFLYSNGVIENLNNFTTGLNGITVYQAVAITNNGLILAIGADGNFVTHVFILTPTGGASKAAHPVQAGRLPHA